MKNNVIIKCNICKGTEFKPTTIGIILATHGHFNVNAYACQNCGHIELFELGLDVISKQLREEKEILRKR